jgi:ubiquinone/menaquinone biosynthesis C-methylase UbiE
MKMYKKIVVGNRVKAIKNYYNKEIIGLLGTVKRVTKYNGILCIEFDKHISGHDCGGSSKFGHGWNVSPECLEIYEEPKVLPVISTVHNKPYFHHSTIEHSDGTITYLDQLIPASSFKAIFNDRTTIVIFDDKSKGISKCDPNDEYDSMKGLEIASLRAYIKSAQKELKNLLK